MEEELYRGDWGRREREAGDDFGKELSYFLHYVLREGFLCKGESLSIFYIMKKL